MHSESRAYRRFVANSTERPRRMSQRDRILDELTGGEWVSNTRLNQIAYRYSARIYELRKMGFEIEIQQDDTIDGLTWYRLNGQAKQDEGVAR